MKSRLVSADDWRDLVSMTTRITYRKEADDCYLGYLNAYPGHWTQGDDLADLK